MPRVGILQTAAGFALTQPTSEKSAVVEIDENLLENLLADEDSETAQEILGVLYATSKSCETWWTRLKTIFVTENAFWHIHGILVSALTLISTFFLTAILAGAVPVEGNSSTLLLFTLVTLSYGASGYGFYALLTRKRMRKRRSALFIFMLFMYLTIFLTLKDGVSETLIITLLSLAGVA